MSPNHLSMRAALLSLFLYKNKYILFKILSKYTVKRSDCNNLLPYLLFLRQNLIKIFTKTHQITPFKKIPEPPIKAHGATCNFIY